MCKMEKNLHILMGCSKYILYIRAEATIRPKVALAPELLNFYHSSLQNLCPPLHINPNINTSAQNNHNPKIIDPKNLTKTYNKLLAGLYFTLKLTKYDILHKKQIQYINLLHNDCFFIIKLKY